MWSSFYLIPLAFLEEYMLSGGEEQVTMSALQLFQSPFLLFFKLTGKISGAFRQRSILFYFFSNRYLLEGGEQFWFLLFELCVPSVISNRLGQAWLVWRGNFSLRWKKKTQLMESREFTQKELHTIVKVKRSDWSTPSNLPEIPFAAECTWYGSRPLGPKKLRLRLDFLTLLANGQMTTVQKVKVES